MGSFRFTFVAILKVVFKPLVPARLWYRPHHGAPVERVQTEQFLDVYIGNQPFCSHDLMFAPLCKPYSAGAEIYGGCLPYATTRLSLLQVFIHAETGGHLHLVKQIWGTKMWLQPLERRYVDVDGEFFSVDPGTAVSVTRVPHALRVVVA